MTQIHISTAYARHIGPTWFTPYMGLRILGRTNNKAHGAEVKLTDWRSGAPGNPPITVQFSVNTNTLTWEEDWMDRRKVLTITGNTAWRIHPDTNLNDVVEIAGVNAQTVGTYSGTVLYGGNGTIDIDASLVNTGSAQIVLEYRMVDQYLTTTINITVNANGLVMLFDVNPSVFNINCDEQTLNAVGEGTGGTTPWLSGLPSWVNDVDIEDDPSDPDDKALIDIHVDDYKVLCHPYPSEWERFGVVEIGSGNGDFPISVRQTYCLHTPEPWPAGNDLVYDASGNAYNYVTIGDYQILLQPLRTLKYRSNKDIPLYTGNGSKNADFISEDAAACRPWDSVENSNRLGMLYNYFAVAEGTYDEGGFMDASSDVGGYGAAYQWHVPTGAEFLEIMDTIHSSAVVEDNGYVKTYKDTADRMRCPKYHLHPATNEIYGPGGWHPNHDAGNNVSKYSAMSGGTLAGGTVDDDDVPIGKYVGYYNNLLWLDAGEPDLPFFGNFYNFLSFNAMMSVRLRHDTDDVFIRNYQQGFTLWTSPFNGFTIRLIRKHDL